jgi:hypothetical protein
MLTKIICEKYRSMQKGALCGFADLYFPEVGFGIRGYKLFQKDGRRWVNPPSKEYTNTEGEKAYQQYQFYKEKEDNDAFTRLALDAISEYCTSQSQTETVDYQAPYKDEDVPF